MTTSNFMSGGHEDKTKYSLPSLDNQEHSLLISSKVQPLVSLTVRLKNLSEHLIMMRRQLITLKKLAEKNTGEEN
jgi:hypothetical protein